MGFVNEFVPEEDIVKYGLKEIDKRYMKGHYKPDWTINREKDVYLRWMHAGREEYSNVHDFTFYWKGTLLDVVLSHRGSSVRGGAGETIWTLESFRIPQELSQHRLEIIDDLKEALVTYKTFGIRSSVTEHTAKFEFGKCE